MLKCRGAQTYPLRQGYVVILWLDVCVMERVGRLTETVGSRTTTGRKP